MKNKKIVIIIIVLVIILIAIIGAIKISNNKKEKEEIEMPEYSIEKNVGNNNCKLSYEKLCFNIPDDYKCVGYNKCQLSNNKDMLLVQVFIEKDYKEDINKYIKKNRSNHSRDNQEQETIELNGNSWIRIYNKYQNTKYYYLKVDNNIYTVKILSKKDSGGKFDELTKIIEESIKIK